MQVLSGFEVLYNTDGTEGRGPVRGTGICFKEEEDAIKFITSKNYSGYAVMGVIPDRNTAKHYVGHKTITVYDSYKDYEEEHGQAKLEKDKINALNKLSKDEIKALKELGL